MALIWLTNLLSKQRVDASRPKTIAGGSLTSTNTQEFVAAEATQLFGWNDAIYLFYYAWLFPNALLTKPESWADRADRLARGLSVWHQRQMRVFEEQVPAAVIDASGETREEVALRCYSRHMLELTEMAAAAFRAYRPSNVELVGAEKLRDALARGKGAILWVTPSGSSSLLSKVALAGEGFRVHHLSRRSHGVSNTRFGIKVLNGIHRRAEAHFIAERIVDSGIRQLGSTRRILEVLGENEAVTITVSDAGTHLVETEMLRGRIKVATGAPNFALRSGAALLPVFSHRDGGRFVVEIGEPIVLEGRKRDEAFRHAVEAYATQLETYVRRYPLDFKGWPDGYYTEP